MINRFKGLSTLRTLNTYLEEQLDSRLSHEEVIEKIDSLIKQIRKSESCFNAAENTTDDYLKFLTFYFKIKGVILACGDDENKRYEALEIVVGIARSHFTQLPAVVVDKRQNHPSINPYSQIRDSCHKILRLNPLDRTFCYETLALWIAEQKVSLDRLDLDLYQLKRLAPHLTYLKISSSRSYREEFDDEYIGKILKRTRQLRHLTIKESAFTGDALVELKNPEQLVSLVFKRCPRFNWPLFQNVTALRKIKIEHCANFWINHRLNFLSPIYVDQKKRALKFAEALQVMHLEILGHLAQEPNPYVDMPSLIDTFSYKTTRSLLWSMVGSANGLRNMIQYPKSLVIALLSTEAGRDFIEQNGSVFLGVSDLLSLLIAAYPPGKPENLPLYPIQERVDGNVLILTMIPTMPRDYPDTVLEIVANTLCKDVSIYHYGRAVKGIREEEKQFFADLMQEMIHSSKLFNFEKLDDGKYMLSSKGRDAKRQAELLGKVFGMALRAECPIGNVLSMEFISSHRNESLMIWKILNPHGDEILKVANKLNRKWQNDELASAIDRGQYGLVQTIVRVAAIKNKLYAMMDRLSEAMISCMPFNITTIQGEVLTIENMKELSDVTTEDLLMQLQGRVETAETILRTPACREFVQNNIEVFLRNAALQPLLLAASPPGKPENASLYPIKSKLINHKLYLTMIPSMPLHYPDRVVEAFAHFPCNKINIAHYGSDVIDEGGPRNQFFADLMQGLIQFSEKYKFERTDSGKLFPVADVDNLTNRQLHFTLGRILGLALTTGSPIGDVFSIEFIHCIRSFSYEAIDNFEVLGNFDDARVMMENIGSLLSVSSRIVEEAANHYKGECITQDPFFKTKSKVDLMTFMKASTPPSPLTTLVEGVLLSDNEEDALAAANEVNKLWFDDELTAAIDARDLDQVAGIVRNNWLAGFNGYMRAAQAMAVGIESCLPFKLRINDRKRDQIRQWDDLAFVTTEQLALQLQGKLTVKWVKDHLVFKPGESPEAQHVKEWINRWLDEHKDEEEVLANVIQTLTGARALTSKIIFKLTKSAQGLYAHTCFQTVDVPWDIDEEGIRAVLDAYGRGEHLQFNRS